LGIVVADSVAGAAGAGFADAGATGLAGAADLAGAAGLANTAGVAGAVGLTDAAGLVGAGAWLMLLLRTLSSSKACNPPVPY